MYSTRKQTYYKNYNNCGITIQIKFKVFKDEGIDNNPDVVLFWIPSKQKMMFFWPLLMKNIFNAIIKKDIKIWWVFSRYNKEKLCWVLFNTAAVWNISMSFNNVKLLCCYKIKPLHLAWREQQNVVKLKFKRASPVLYRDKNQAQPKKSVQTYSTFFGRKPCKGTVNYNIIYKP